MGTLTLAGLAVVAAALVWYRRAQSRRGITMRIEGERILWMREQAERRAERERFDAFRQRIAGRITGGNPAA